MFPPLNSTVQTAAPGLWRYFIARMLDRRFKKHCVCCSCGATRLMVGLPLFDKHTTAKAEGSAT